MEEVITLAEMHARFESEWVLVEDPELDEQGEIVRGRILFHSKDRDEVYRKDLELRPESAGYVYTGRIPENAAVIL